MSQQTALTDIEYRDYNGARAYGLSALLLRRPGPDGDAERKEDDEDLSNVETVASLLHVVDWVKRRNLV